MTWNPIFTKEEKPQMAHKYLASTNSKITNTLICENVDFSHFNLDGKHLLVKVGAYFLGVKKVKKPKVISFHTFHMFHNIINQQVTYK